MSWVCEKLHLPANNGVLTSGSKQLKFGTKIKDRIIRTVNRVPIC